MKLAITVDNQALQLYVDGVQIPRLTNYSDWTKVDFVNIPANTRVIAIQGRDLHVSYSRI